MTTTGQARVALVDALPLLRSLAREAVGRLRLYAGVLGVADSADEVLHLAQQAQPCGWPSGQERLRGDAGPRRVDRRPWLLGTAGRPPAVGSGSQLAGGAPQAPGMGPSTRSVRMPRTPAASPVIACQVAGSPGGTAMRRSTRART